MELSRYVVNVNKRSMKLISKEPPRAQKYTIEVSYGELYDIQSALMSYWQLRNILPKDDQLYYSVFLEIKKILKP